MGKEKIEMFVLMLDEMILQLQEILDEETENVGSSMTRKFLNNFLDIRQSVLTGKLPPSGGGGLGAGRAMSEFNYNDLAELGNQIDEFYRTQLVTL